MRAASNVDHVLAGDASGEFGCRSATQKGGVFLGEEPGEREPVEKTPLSLRRVSVAFPECPKSTLSGYKAEVFTTWQL